MMRNRVKAAVSQAMRATVNKPLLLLLVIANCMHKCMCVCNIMFICRPGCSVSLTVIKLIH